MPNERKFITLPAKVIAKTGILLLVIKNGVFPLGGNHIYNGVHSIQISVCGDLPYSFVPRVILVNSIQINTIT